ncbi:MAG: FAD-dependent monooxygenase [Burkholderiaceae bacterium]
MQNTTDYPVAIIGAGPVGLTIANLLGTYGVACVLIEQSPGTSAHPRAQTIDDESMRTLQAFGCAQKFMPLVRPANGSDYYDENGERFAHVGPGPKNYGFSKRSYMLQQELDKILLENLTGLPSVTRRFNSKLLSFDIDDSGVNLQLNGGESLRCQYLLACDGGQSSIRKALGIAMKGWTYEQDWIVLDAVDDPDTDTVSRFFCDQARPMVSIASPNNGRRYEFMLLPGESRDEVLSDQNLAQLLKPYRPWDPSKITRRAVYTFHARIAEKLSEGPVFLLGDSAHLTPPFAGQGMNAGIRDAQNMAWKLAVVCQHGLPASLLSSYEAERRGPIWAMIQVAVAMGEFVMPVGDEQVALKASVLKALERFPQARSWLFEMRFKPTPRYDAGIFVNLENQLIEASLVGEMMPQPQVICADGATVLLDELLGAGFSLIVQDAAGAQALARLTGPIWSVLAPIRVFLNFGAAGPVPNLFGCVMAQIPKAAELSDNARKANDSYARPLRSHRGQILLVRPDRYVAGACFIEDVDAFNLAVAAAFGLSTT